MVVMVTRTTPTSMRSSLTSTTRARPPTTTARRDRARAPTATGKPHPLHPPHNSMKRYRRPSPPHLKGSSLVSIASERCWKRRREAARFTSNPQAWNIISKPGTGRSPVRRRTSGRGAQHAEISSNQSPRSEPTSGGFATTRSPAPHLRVARAEVATTRRLAPVCIDDGVKKVAAPEEATRTLTSPLRGPKNEPEPPEKTVEEATFLETAKDYFNQFKEIPAQKHWICVNQKCGSVFGKEKVEPVVKDGSPDVVVKPAAAAVETRRRSSDRLAAVNL